MKHTGKVVICLAGGLALHTGARAVTADSAGNPYAGIVDRNVFALKPMPTPPPPVDPTVTPPQKITLTGIVNAFGKKQVYLRTLMSKPGEAPKETNLMLSEGERAGEIEILEINEVLHTVRVRNHGLEQTLSLEKDGMKPTGGPGAVPGAIPAVAALGIPGVSATRLPVPGGGSTITTFGGTGGAASVQRQLRVNNPTTAAGYSTAAGVPSTAAGVPTQGQAKAMSPEEQVVHMEIYRKLNTDGPPLPPTEVTPPGLPGQ